MLVESSEMEAILKFQLPEEQEEFNVAVRGKDLYLALLGLDNVLRRMIKSSEDGARTAVLERIRDELYAAMENYGVHLDMMS